MFNNLFLFKNIYAFDQRAMHSYKEIINYIQESMNETDTICFYKDGNIYLQYWYHKYYLAFTSHKFKLAGKENLNDCSAIIVDEAPFIDSNFSMKTGLKASNTKIYTRDK